MAKKIVLGIFLMLVILSTTFYVYMPGKVRIDFTKTRTIFKVYEDGKFVISGIEYTRLFDGTKLMRAKNRTIEYQITDKETYVKRASYFKDSIIATDYYGFDNDAEDVESVPVSHGICIENAKGKIFEYLVSNIEFKGTTQDIPSPFSFGKNMTVTFQKGYYRAKVYNNKVRPDKIIVRYRVNSDNECFDVRLFDPKFISKLTKIKDCKVVYWNETEKINGTEFYSTDIKITEKSKEVCIETGKINVILSNLTKVNIEYDDFFCVYTDLDEIICTHKTVDGDVNYLKKYKKCKSGQTCVKRVLKGNEILYYERNSEKDFVEKDRSMFLDVK